MTVIEKLSDRKGFIYEVILIILKNNPPMRKTQLQYELVKCGVYIKLPLLLEAIDYMEKKKLILPNEKKETDPKEASSGKASAPIVQLEPR